jgi:hypothetical protein
MHWKVKRRIVNGLGYLVGLLIILALLGWFRLRMVGVDEQNLMICATAVFSAICGLISVSIRVSQKRIRACESSKHQDAGSGEVKFNQFCIILAISAALMYALSWVPVIIIEFWAKGPIICL